MEAVILSKEVFEKMHKDITEMKTHVMKLRSPTEHVMDNKAFVKLMKISYRTAQVWRDTGKIGFSQEGKKIYYRMSDVETFLEKTHCVAFANQKRI